MADCVDLLYKQIFACKLDPVASEAGAIRSLRSYLPTLSHMSGAVFLVQC